jgi:hypothetical protein
MHDPNSDMVGTLLISNDWARANALGADPRRGACRRLANADLRAGLHGFIIRDFIIRFSIPLDRLAEAMPDTSNHVRSV